MCAVDLVCYDVPRRSDENTWEPKSNLGKGLLADFEAFCRATAAKQKAKKAAFESTSKSAKEDKAERQNIERALKADRQVSTEAVK